MNKLGCCRLPIKRERFFFGGRSFHLWHSLGEVDFFSTPGSKTRNLNYDISSSYDINHTATIRMQTQCYSVGKNISNNKTIAESMNLSFEISSLFQWIVWALKMSMSFPFFVRQQRPVLLLVRNPGLTSSYIAQKYSQLTIKCTIKT